MKSEIAKAVQDQVFDFEKRFNKLKEQKQQFSRSKTVEDKRFAKERLKELQPSVPKPQKEPWKESHNHNYIFEQDLKRLQGRLLTNPEIHRIHMIKRSYDERLGPGKTEGFKYPRWSANFFPLLHEKMLTEEGKNRNNRCIGTHENHVQKCKDAEDYFQANKRRIFEEQMNPRWAPSKNQCGPIHEYPSDANYLFTKDLLPLDAQPYQTLAFRRTNRQGEQFSIENSSII